MSDRLYRTRLDLQTQDRVRQWRERREPSRVVRWWGRYGVLVGWVLVVMSGLGTGAVLVWLSR